ncbi:MAG: hypothetical protein RLY66_382 [Candidatus Parcubacteria bacterium]|jgi:anti-anti-sigma regulatory factor
MAGEQLPGEINIVLTPEVRQRISEIMEKSGLDLTSVFRRSLMLLDSLQHFEGDGCQIIIRAPNGEERILCADLWGVDGSGEGDEKV